MSDSITLSSGELLNLLVAVARRCYEPMNMTPEYVACRAHVEATGILATRTVPLSDAIVLTLYGAWSEETYGKGFLGPVPWAVREFRVWLAGRLASGVTEDYERDMLAEYRRQEGETP